MTVHIDRRARHRTGEEGDGAGIRALRVLSANDGGTDIVGVDDVRNILDRFGYGRIAGLFLLISSAVLTDTDEAVFFMSRATFSPVTTIGFNTVVPAVSAC